MEFFWQEYWSKLPFPPPGDLHNTRIEPMSLVFPALAGGFFLNEPPGKPGYIYPITTLLVESSISYHQPSPWSSVITKLLNNASAPQIEVNVSLPLEKPLNMKTATFLPATLRLGWKPYETSLKSVLFYSSCYNGIPQTGWLINNINFFLTG